ncbi:putative transposase (plasmid) [Rhodococcus opacus B4]|uniref:Putative transposase n=1 Tax=Rhodococcus opacus (strain B4) TaxID=632772 RepID=C1BDU0_RHOOB|nr:putative transposase [Rhodococcus opacus B4]
MATRGPRPTEIVLTETERVELEGWSRRRKTAAGLAVRSRIILAAPMVDRIPKWRRGWG